MGLERFGGIYEFSVDADRILRRPVLAESGLELAVGMADIEIGKLFRHVGRGIQRPADTVAPRHVAYVSERIAVLIVEHRLAPSFCPHVTGIGETVRFIDKSLHVGALARLFHPPQKRLFVVERKQSVPVVVFRLVYRLLEPEPEILAVRDL